MDATGMYELVGATLSGALFLAVYSETTSPSHDESLLLGAGILLILEAGVALLCMASSALADMLAAIKAPLFRCHELFAFALASAAFGSVPADERELYVAGLVVLTLFILSNLFMTAPSAADDEVRPMTFSRFLSLLSSILVMVEVFEQNPTIQTALVTTHNYLPFLALGFLVFGEFVRSMYTDTEFSSQGVYVALITLIALTSFARFEFVEAGSTVVNVLGGTRGMQLGAYITLLFAVGAAHYAPTR